MNFLMRYLTLDKESCHSVSLPTKCHGLLLGETKYGGLWCLINVGLDLL